MNPGANSKELPRMARWLAILLVLSLLVSMLPQGVLAAPLDAKDDCKRSYEVTRTDTLKKIARRFGVSVATIVAENDMKKPYTIYIGQRLCIPKRTKKGLSNLPSKNTNTYAVFFVASRAGNDIIIYTYNYPKTTVLVKGENAGDSKWKLVDIGKINIATQGNRKAIRFKLPPELRVKKLMICLKDKSSGNLQCVYQRFSSK